MSSRSAAIAPYLLLASLSLFWGLNWPGMKIILTEMTVWWFRALCLVFGGGLAADGGTVFATTGFGEILAEHAKGD